MTLDYVGALATRGSITVLHPTRSNSEAVHPGEAPQSEIAEALVEFARDDGQP